jgi:hypothetical protein
LFLGSRRWRQATPLRERARIETECIP